jgi:hypothetical protein
MRSRQAYGFLRAADDRILMADDPPRQLEGLIAIVSLGRAQHAIENLASERGCGRFLESGDEFSGGLQPVDAFVLGADVGSLE